MKKEKKGFAGLSPFLTELSAISQIMGISIVTIIPLVIQIINSILVNNNLISIIAGFFALVMIILIYQKYKFDMTDKDKKLEMKDKELEEKNKELEEKNKELEMKISELEEKDKNLIEKNTEIDELRDRIKACKTAVIDTKNLTPLDYYLIDKDVYDNFKSNLRVSECCLEVELIKLHENSEKHNLHFCWRLVVKNCGSEPADKANFIYSGEKDMVSNLNITTEKVTFDNYETIPDKKVLGDDRFIEINFSDEILVGNSAVIHIDYVFEKYKFNKEHDRIWLVPDALGFAGMDQFCIVFYCDGEIVHKETKVELKSYKLKGEYNLGRMRQINFSDPNNKKGKFQAKSRKKEELHGHGYVLELSNSKQFDSDIDK